MAVFDGGDNFAEDENILAEGLHLAFKGQGDSIYTALPK
jgi:hypothetical protein